MSVRRPPADTDDLLAASRAADRDDQRRRWREFGGLIGAALMALAVLVAIISGSYQTGYYHAQKDLKRTSFDIVGECIATADANKWECRADPLAPPWERKEVAK